MPPTAIRTEVVPERTALRLSESMRVEIAISGPAPLRVEPPKEWLADVSSGLWKMQSLGSPQLKDTADGQRWSQSFQLDPFVAGSQVPLIFVPLKVNDSETALPSFSIEVTTIISKASPEEARPITGMEQLPPRTVASGTNYAPVWAGAAVLIGLIIVLFWRRRPKKSVEPTPIQQTLEELRRLEPTRDGFLDTLTGILRDWLERGPGLPAKSRTAAELREGHPAFEPILTLLEECDRVKFSGETRTLAERETLQQRAIHYMMLQTAERKPDDEPLGPDPIHPLDDFHDTPPG